MPRTSEIAFNLELSNVLRTKHPRWRDRTSAEQRGILRETALQPDIVIRPAKWHPGRPSKPNLNRRTVSKKTPKNAWGNSCSTGVPRLSRPSPSKIPRALSEVPQEDLEREIEAAEFHYCTYSLQAADTAVRWAGHWLARRQY